VKLEIIKGAVHIMAAGILAIGAINLYGTLTRLSRLATWGIGVPMAVPTAVCFILTGLSLLVLSNRLKQ